jgi:shikimate dehydrogenase
MSHNATTKVAGVIGWPVDHSKSPRLHGYWLDRYGLDGAYLPLPVVPGRLESAVHGLSALGFRGANVTIPHKEAVIQLVDRVDAIAQRIGAVNTLVVSDSGELEGRNTDAYGFLTNLCMGGSDWVTAPDRAVILGAGGAARAVIVALQDFGVRQLRVVNRSRGKAEALRAVFGPIIEVVDWAERHEALADAGLLVNTTSLGMAGQPPLELELGDLPTGAVVTDIVYSPLVTPLLRTAAARGNPTVDGLGMLLHQAVPGFEAWFGRRPEVTAALRQHLLDG